MGLPHGEQDNTPHKPEHRGSYLRSYINPQRLREFVDLATRALKGHEFDAIAFTGMSGALVAPAIAMALGKEMLMVRKPSYEIRAHSDMSVEGDYAARSYVIVDDQVSTGDTRRRIMERVAQVAPQAKYIGLLAINDLNSREVSYWEHRGKPYPLSKELVTHDPVPALA